jgi:hypothetical protein
VKSVIDHINSFPRVESHYCRATTNRQYLDVNLSIPLMYQMYCSSYEVPPVKLHKYREVFMTKFNLSFHVPRKDRCDKCEEMKMNRSPSEEQFSVHREHQTCKMLTKDARDADRALSDKTHAVVCFDLQNVVSLPHANIKSMFYLRKLSVYNLTAHCSLDRSGYCAVWAENVSGRSGNDISSALIELLNRIVQKHAEITRITLWSDVCVAQNKNRVMTLALLKFLSEHPGILQIVQKFGTPGHSAVQEVDNIHSQIEKRIEKF